MQRRDSSIVALAVLAIGACAAPAHATTTAGFGIGADRNVLFVDGDEGDNNVTFSTLNRLTHCGSNACARRAISSWCAI